jgi:hypothetical protein
MHADPTAGLLQFHHTGCAVKNIEETLAAFRPFFPRISKSILIATQAVRVCFVELKPGSYLEFVEAAGERPAIAVMLKRGISFYHLGFLTDHFDLALHTLAQQNYLHLETFHSEAFAGKRCAFLMSDTMQLIELIESGHDIMEAE